MSYGSWDVLACPNLQENIADYFVSGDPTVNREIKALTGFLLSDDNKSVLNSRIDSGNGHKRTVELTYFPRLEATSTSATPSCAGGDELTQCSTTYEIDTTVGTSKEMRLQLRDIEKGCADDEFYFSKVLMQEFDAIYRKMNKTNAAQAAALVGNHATTGTSAAVNATVTASGNYSNDFVQTILYEMAESEIENTVPVAIGGSQKFWNYRNASEFAQAADGLNIDVSSYLGRYGFPMLYDRDIETSGAFAADELLVLVPGALQLLTFNRFAPDGNTVAVMNDDLYKQGTITDPRTGIMFDYVAKYNTCDGLSWDIWVGLSHKLVGMPSDLFNPSDRLEGVTYAYKFKAVAS